jgi:hypothetical protein
MGKAPESCAHVKAIIDVITLLRGSKSIDLIHQNRCLLATQASFDAPKHEDHVFTPLSLLDLYRLVLLGQSLAAFTRTSEPALGLI